MPFPLILGSTSKYRKDLLSQLGWPCEAVAPGVDEEKIKAKGQSPLELVQELSQLKARAVAVRYPSACVIGSDQVCTLDGKIFDKPGTLDLAASQLSLLQGKKHQLLTSVTILYPGGMKNILNETTLTMRPMTMPEIYRYLSEDSPMDCAGSYKLESRGIKLFSEIDMKDHTAIIGLPLIELTDALLELGYSL